MTERENFEQAADQWIDRVVRDFRSLDDLLRRLHDYDNGIIVAPEDGEEPEDDFVQLVELLEAYDFMAEDLEDTDALRDQIREESEGYGASLTTVVRIELMGGGPAGWLNLEIDASDRWPEFVGGEIAYCDWFQVPRVRKLNPAEVDAIVNTMQLDAGTLIDTVRG